MRWLAVLMSLALMADTRAAEWEPVPAAQYKARDAAIEALRAPLAAANLETFEPMLHRGEAGKVMHYRLFRPEAQGGQKYPLVLVLHGSGTRGMDNVAQLNTRGGVLTAGIWTTAENQKARPCFVLAPQCPPEPEAWIRTPGWEDGSHPLQAEPTAVATMAMAILEKVCATEAVDVDRIYITGVSMGGYGTWDYLARWPERFAAAVPVCGGMPDAVAVRIAKVPVWIFHGDADDVVSVTDARSAFRQLRAAGAAPRYTEYAGGGHQISSYAWTEPGLMEWLFAQRRR
jgi:predicted peptidase